jgi:hypothetical protein
VIWFGGVRCEVRARGEEGRGKGEGGRGKGK